MARLKISARVNTYNEEDNIGACLESLRWADEILVVDSFSTDRTVEVARRYTDRILQRRFTSHGDQHNFADTQCAHDWVLALDADERLTPELQAELRAVQESGTGLDGFRMARCAFYLGRWIRHSGWFPDWQTRLYRRAVTHWAGDPPHEAPKVAGPIGTLRGEMQHYTRRSLHEHVQVMNSYTDLAAAARHGRGEGIGRWQLATTPAWTFFHTYVVRQGFRDGWQGMVIAWLAAAYVHLRQAKMMELDHASATAPGAAGTLSSAAGSKKTAQIP